MANQLMTVKDFARAALPRLMEHLVFPNLIYKDYSQDFAGMKGDTVQVRKPVVFTASEFDQENGDALRNSAFVKVANTETGAWDFVSEQTISE